MTTDAAHPGDPFRLLASARELARRVRQEQRATWFPLLVFAALTFAAIPIRRYSDHFQTCRANECINYSDADLIYWPVALVLAYVAIVAFSIWRSRARGVDTRVRPYAIVGIAVAVVLTAVAYWEFHHPVLYLVSLGRFGLPHQFASPGFGIGTALLVLTWVERNRALLLVALGYLMVVLVPITFGPDGFNPPWYATPAVSQGTVLLLAGVGFALAQRPLWSSAR
jgi:hypothetical protein